MGKRLTIEYARQCFLDEGCELLETEYINAKTKMRYRCSCGNKSKICFDSFRRGSRCSKCGGNEKLTFEFVDKCFRDNGCILLETEYINVKTKMRYICNCGRESKICFNHFQQGKRCSKCGGTEKLTIEYAKQFFKDNGCELLETEYKNAQTKMKYICNCKNESETTFNNFQQGQRCIKCGIKRSTEKRKHTFESVFKCFKENGCELLETKYINNHTLMRYRCSCGNESEICFSSFKQGNRCNKCGMEKIAEKLKHTFEYVDKCFRDGGCELLETEYINNHTLMRYICICGEKNKITFANFQQGKRCRKCGIEKNSGKNNPCYNHNITDEEREIGRNYPEYREWVKSVYKRDDYTCQKCFQRGGKLVAHHIEGYANNKDIRTDINNGITFCSDCHHEFHRIYGKKNVNRLQLEEFLQMDVSKK